MAGEKKRHLMMQNLFGDQSEEEDEEEAELVQDSEKSPHGYALEEDGEGMRDLEGEGEGEVPVERESGDMQDENEHGESESESNQSVDQREESHGRDSEADDDEEYSQRVVTSRRHDVIDNGSDRSENRYADIGDEVNQARSESRSPLEEKDEVQVSNSAPEIRDVFGDSEDDMPTIVNSDDEGPVRYDVQNEMGEDEEPAIGDSDDERPTRFGVQNEMGEESHQRSPIEEEGIYEKELGPEDMVPDEYGQYGSEEDHVDKKHKEKPMGPPLELEIPLQHPPALPEMMHLIKVSNIMGIDPKPFDSKTYVEEDVFVKDESGSNKRISLVNNIVRWREVKNSDGRTSIESNARFVHWSDGTIQLMIGNEVLDTTIQDAQHDQAHLFLRHGKGILQSQGRILSKMKFMPSSLSSNSHRLLTALVDSRHKKVYKVKNCVTDIDPEREKEQKERAESQMIRASVSLNRKKEKVSRKYMPTVRRERQLSPGFLEDGPEEEEETDYYESRRPAARHRFDEDLEMEAQAERRIMNAKKREIPRKTPISASKPSKRPIDFSESEKEESEYETEGEEEKVEQEYEEEEHEQEEEEAYEESEDEVEDTKPKGRESGASLKRKGIESDEESPPRKATTHRRMAIVYDSDEE